jgi:folate-binding protein YgfZ
VSSSLPSLQNDAYLAVQESAAYYVVPSPGTLLISGQTRREYLQRQTSNNLDLLSAARTLPTLLPSASGRILEVFTLVSQDDTVGLLTQPGHAPGLAAYFQKHRFFNDQVEIADQSAAWAQVELHGPKAAEVLEKLGFARAPALDEVEASTWRSHSFRVIGEEGFGAHLRYRLLVPASANEVLLTALQFWPAMDLTIRRVLRVEAKQAGDPEFNGEYTPFEIGIGRLVSGDKGCYTGQEVLARQVTYDKVVRKLVRLQALSPLESGASVFADGKPAGQVTSAAISPKLGAIALAVLRRPYDELGLEIEVQQSSRTQPASII